MNKKELKQKLEAGTMFLDINYGEGDIQIYHDVVEDRYYSVEETRRLKEVYLVAEKRYCDGGALNDEDLVNDSSIEYDISGEFDNPIETAGPYVFRYGYFKYRKKNETIPVAKIIGFTDLI